MNRTISSRKVTLAAGLVPALAVSLIVGCGAIKLNFNGKSSTPGGGGGRGGGATPAVTSATASSVATSNLDLPATAEQKVSAAVLTPRLTTAAFAVAVADRGSDLGFRCGKGHAQGYTTRAPAFSFEVTEAFDLQVRMVEAGDGVGGLLVFPDGTTICGERGGAFLSATWPVGTYHLFLLTAASSASARLEFSSAAVALAKTPILVVDQPTSKPSFVQTGAVTYVGSYSRVFGDTSYSASCSGRNVSDTPAAIIQLPEGSSARLSGWGDNYAGMVVRAGKQVFLSCANFREAPAGGWPAGRLEVYPMGDLDRAGNSFIIAVDDPRTPATDDQIQQVRIAGKLAKPRLVTVPLRDGRWQMPKPLSGSDCGSAAFAGIADLIITIDRPVAGLVIKPLAAATPVRTLVRYPGQSYCPGTNDLAGALAHPRWEATGTVALGGVDGSFELQVGAPAGLGGSVTYMIYDDSTELSPLARHELAPTALGDRWLARAFPQLDLRRLATADRAGIELAASVFAAAPTELFVYAKLDLDHELIRPWAPPTPTLPIAAAGATVGKGEPLLVLDVDNGLVLAADGAVFQTKPKYLTPDPGGAPAWPAQPRAIDPELEMEQLAALVPTTSSTYAAYEAQQDRFGRCKQKAFEPYARKLPSIERPGGVDLVIVKNVAYRRIEEAGERAVIAKCGTDEAFEAKVEKLRGKLLAEFVATRPAHLRAARAGR